MHEASITDRLAAIEQSEHEVSRKVDQMQATLYRIEGKLGASPKQKDHLTKDGN
jgi:hypothetical protein